MKVGDGFSMSLVKSIKTIAGRAAKRFRRRSRYDELAKNLTIAPHTKVRGEGRITFGDDVYIGPFSQIKAMTKTGFLARHPNGEHMDQDFDGSISIGNRVSVNSGLHLAAYRYVSIGDDVLIASNVYIVDAFHGYERGDVPYKYQGMSGMAPIVIKKGCWIGQNVCIMPGVTIGEYCIVGANSVVTKSIPDQSIAVGVPARVIKCWNKIEEKWMPVDRTREDESGGE